MKTTSRLTLLTVLWSVAPFAGAAEPPRPLYRDASQSIETRVEDLLGRMTLEEKVGQMNMPCVYESALGNTIPEKTKAVQKFAAGTLLKDFGPGGGFFTLPNTILHEGPRQQAEFLNRLQRLALEQTRLGIPLLQTEEGTHGLMCPGGTVFPEGPALGSTWNMELLGPRLCRRGQGSTCDRRAPDLHSCRRADPRSASRAATRRRSAKTPSSARGSPGPSSARFRGATFPPTTRSSPASATIPARASPSAVSNAGPWRSPNARFREVFLPPWQAGIKHHGARSA